MPYGLAALCVVSLFGLKDTGIFINEHVQTTYSGNKVYFEVGEVANIIDESNDGYIVSKGKAKVTVPVEKVKLTESEITTYKVIKNTSIKDSEDQILRNLFLGEEVVLVDDLGENLVIKSDDNIKGQVAKANLELVGTETIKYDEPVNLDNNVQSIDIEQLEKEEEEIEKIAKQGANIEVDEYVPSTDNAKASEAIDLALEHMGTKYVYGATGDGGFDCSGLIYAVYKNKLGINLPRSSSEQSTYGTQVSRNNLEPGDLVFFNTAGGGVSHVGIYMGGDNFVHASSGQGKVVISSLNEDYYDARYNNATRVL
ncbi:NlpC/P60 family protein [Anaerosphaera multitolerans]|uniref:NlpC/P60 family protein n=1 Tax=Anaerosphaera multitolerans TaxID=2487351 RepID=A0A437S8Q3_9FIRM|nr:NlpC/P60 family protein [Anaerosphaera multitolerans]